MLVDWIAQGFPVDLFWNLTPLETALHFKAAAKREERENLRLRWHVWHQAALPRQQKFPSFKEFVHPPAQETTPEQRMSIAAQWAAAVQR
jgi:hypothetical protein